MRYTFLLLLAALLALPFLAPSSASRETKSDSDSSNRLIVVTPHNGDIRKEFAEAFNAWHRARYGTDVYLDYHVPGGTSDLVRLLTHSYDAYRRADKSLPDTMNVDYEVVWGGGDYTFYHDLSPVGILQPMHLDPKLLHEAFPQDALAGVRLYDSTRDASGTQTPTWVGVCLSSFGIIYNTELYQTLNLPTPTSWDDLTRPELFGLVALADPAHSGSSSVAYMMVLQRAMADAEQALFARHPELKSMPRAALAKRDDYQIAIAAGWKRGMGQLLLIGANARYYTDSSEVVPNDVGRAEAAAGMAIDFYARVEEGIVGPERAQFIAPHAATAITPDGVAILHGVSGRQLTLATHFVEYLLTPEAQRLWILRPGEPGGPRFRSPRRMPVRRDVYANQTGWIDHVNPFEEAGGFNQRGEWMAYMTDTRPFWNIAWIDTHDQLIDAYRRIISVPDATKRKKLLAGLADIPVTLNDVKYRRDHRAEIEKSRGDADEWLAEQRIAWGKKFREHYARVAREVESD